MRPEQAPDIAAHDDAGETPLWRRILLELTADLDLHRYPPGAGLLPEVALARRFGANRDTGRRTCRGARDASTSGAARARW